MIVANLVNSPNYGIGHDDNQVSVLWKDNQQDFACMNKQKLARLIVSLVSRVFLKDFK